MRNEERARDKTKPKYGGGWDAEGVRSLRRHMGLSQDEMAAELGTRQQTVSEWETGRYRPRGASSMLLSIIAERAGYAYDSSGTNAALGEREAEE